MSESSQLQILRQNQRSLTLGLLWGGVMLAILAFWIGAAADAPRSAVVLLFIIAVAAFGFAVRQFLRRTSADEPKQIADLNAQRGVIGKVLIGAGLLLVAIALWLVLWLGLAAFGNSLGLALLGMIAAGAGWYQLSFAGRAVDQDKIFEGLAQKGILAAIARPFSSGRESANAVRIVVLVIGGVVGFLLTITAFLWAWIWRNEVIFAGLAAWRGEQSWKLWLCAYVSLLGLAVMFASLVLARFDIRADPLFRRLLYGYNAILVGLLLLEFLIVLNIFVYVLFPMNFHWSEARGFYTLSESAKDILQKLDKPAKIYVLLSHPVLEKDTRNFLDNAQAISGRLQVKYISPDKQFSDVEDLAGRYQAILSESAGTRRGLGLGVLVVYGDEPPSPKDEQPPHTMISVDKIYGFSQSQRSGAGSYSFKGEEVIISELRFLAEGRTKSKIYFLQGNGELTIGSDRIPTRPAHLPMKLLGIGRLFDRLKKENYDVRGLSFGEGKSNEATEFVQAGKSGKKEIPEDARVVVIAGPSEELPKETMEALGRYAKDRKGKLLVMMDMVLKLDKEQKNIEGMVNTGLENALVEFGVDITNEYIHRLPPLERNQQGMVVARGDPIRAFAVIAKNDTILAAKFLGQEFDLKAARIIKPIRRGTSFNCETLLHVVPEEQENGIIWAEKNYLGLYAGLEHSRNVFQNGQLRALRSKDPLPVAVTVTETDGTPRMVVIGDAEMASDREIVGRNGSVNFNFLTSALDWLADRRGIGIRPKEGGVYEYPRDVSAAAMVLPPAWLMMLSVIGVGVGVWVVRRR